MTARIADRGYRSFDGRRGGRGHAIRVLWFHGVTRALGIRRPIWAKVVVITTAILAYIPAVVFVGLTALLTDQALRDLVLPTYGEYYGFVTAAIVLFTAFVAPELLCTDRRSGMLGLYLASPLDRISYLAARAGSVAVVLGGVTIGPPLLLLVAYSLQNNGPEGILGFIEVGARILGAGLSLTIFMTALSMAAASFSDRNAVASAVVIIGLLASRAVAAILVGPIGAPAAAGLLDLFSLPFEMASRFHAEETAIETVGPLSNLAVFAGGIGWVALFAASVRWRYLRADVRR